MLHVFIIELLYHMIWHKYDARLQARLSKYHFYGVMNFISLMVCYLPGCQQWIQFWDLNKVTKTGHETQKKKGTEQIHLILSVSLTRLTCLISVGKSNDVWNYCCCGVIFYLIIMICIVNHFELMSFLLSK